MWTVSQWNQEQAIDGVELFTTPLSLSVLGEMNMLTRASEWGVRGWRLWSEVYVFNFVMHWFQSINKTVSLRPDGEVYTSIVWWL